MQENNNLYLYMNINSKDYLVGTLTIHKKEEDNKEYSSFEYDNSWFEQPFAFSLGFNMPLKEGIYTSYNEEIFHELLCQSYVHHIDFSFEYLLLYLYNNHLLNDNSFDINSLNDWFKTSSSRSPKFVYGKKLSILKNIPLLDDFTRAGSIRYKLKKDGNFIRQIDNNLPKLNEIDKIISIINKIKSNKATTDEQNYFFNCICALDGRQPKFSVLDENNNLCIAKISSIYDNNDIPFLVELLALKIAEKAKINIQNYTIRETTNGQKFILIKRFDRIGNKRIPFLNIHTQLDYPNRNNNKAIAKVIKKFCKLHATKNLNEYFARYLIRILFSTYGSFNPNTSIIYDKGTNWNLSPDYDITVNYDYLRTKNELERIYLSNLIYRRKKLKKIIKNKKIFKVNKPQLRRILNNLKIAFHNWQVIAKEIGFTDEQIPMIKIYSESLKAL